MCAVLIHNFKLDVLSLKKDHIGYRSIVLKDYEGKQSDFLSRVLCYEWKLVFEMTHSLRNGS